MTNGLSARIPRYDSTGRSKEGIIDGLSTIERPAFYQVGLLLGNYSLIDGHFGIGYKGNHGQDYRELTLLWNRDEEMVLAGKGSKRARNVRIFTPPRNPDLQNQSIVLKFATDEASGIFLGDDLCISTTEGITSQGYGLLVSIQSRADVSVIKATFAPTFHPGKAFDMLASKWDQSRSATPTA